MWVVCPLLLNQSEYLIFKDQASECGPMIFGFMVRHDLLDMTETGKK